MDDVQTFYDSTKTPQAQTVDIYATPLIDISALNVTALFAQDSYSIKRFTLTAGLRWERLEGYLPAQSSPPSAFFPNLQRNWPEVRNVVLWHTAGPRIAGIYDIAGDGRTAAKASWGRYYYILSTGGGGVSNVNPNATYFATYTWNDVNGDLKFQPGEQTGPPSLTSGTTTTIDPNFSRPYTDEYSFAVDHEVVPNTRLSVVYTYRREKNLQASYNPDNPYASTPTTAIDPGPDGVIGTADDSTYQYYQRISPLNHAVITNDPNVLQSYNGLEITVTRRFTKNWSVLAGYTRSKNEISNVSVDVSPNYLINASGNISPDARCSGCGASNADRPNQFKLTGIYILPWYEIITSANYAAVSGPPITRQINRSLAFGAAQTINLEPIGADRLPFENRLDLRVGKVFKFANNRSLEGSVDFDNIFNADWVWQARSLTPAAKFTDPTTGITQTLPQFLSPAVILPPRTVVLRANFKF